MQAHVWYHGNTSCNKFLLRLLFGIVPSCTDGQTHSFVIIKYMQCDQIKHTPFDIPIRNGIIDGSTPVYWGLEYLY